MGLLKCLCPKPPMRYKNLVRPIYPSNRNDEPRNMKKIVEYTQREQKRTPTLVRYLAKRLDQQIKKRNHWHAEITVAALDLLVSNGNLSIFYFHIIEIIKKLLDQPEVQLRMLGLELLMTYINHRDGEDLYKDIKATMIVQSTVRMCELDMSAARNGGPTTAATTRTMVHIYTGKRWETGDIVWSARSVGLRALAELASHVSDAVNQYMSDILSAIIANISFSHDAEKEHFPFTPPSQEMTNMASIEEGSQASLSKLAHQVLRTVCSFHEVVTIMNLMETLLSIFDSSNLWTSTGTNRRLITSPRVLSIISTLSAAVQSQNTHIIFSTLFRKLDESNSAPKLNVIEVITFASRIVHPAGPWVLEGLNSVTRHIVLHAESQPETSDLDSGEVGGLRSALFRWLHTLSCRLTAHSQTATVILMILQRLPSVKSGMFVPTNPTTNVPSNLRAQVLQGEMLPPSDKQLSKKERRVQLELLRALVVVVSAAPSIYKTLPLPGSSKLLNTLLYASLVNDPDCRLITTLVLHATVSGKTFPYIVRAAREADDTTTKGSLNKHQSMSALNKILSLAKILNDVEVAALVEAEPPVLAKSESAVAIVSSSPTASPALEAESPSRFMQSAAPIALDEPTHWQGFDRDWDAIYHVIFRHLVMNNNKEGNAAVVCLLLDLMLRRYNVRHIQSVLPILLGAQSQLVASQPPNESSKLSWNASHMIVVAHFCRIASTLGNEMVKVQCRVIMDERQRALQTHPRLTHHPNSGAIHVILPSTVTDLDVLPITKFVSPILITDVLLAQQTSSDHESDGHAHSDSDQVSAADSDRNTAKLDKRSSRNFKPGSAQQREWLSLLQGIDLTNEYQPPMELGLLKEEHNQIERPTAPKVETKPQNTSMFEAIFAATQDPTAESPRDRQNYDELFGHAITKKTAMEPNLNRLLNPMSAGSAPPHHSKGSFVVVDDCCPMFSLPANLSGSQLDSSSPRVDEDLSDEDDTESSVPMPKGMMFDLNNRMPGTFFVGSK